LTLGVFNVTFATKYNKRELPMKNIQSGRSMIEMLGVLAITGLLSVAGISGFIKAQMQRKVNTTIDQITALAAKLSVLGTSEASYDGLSNATVMQMKISTIDIDKANNTFINPFGGSVTIKADTAEYNSGDTQAYSIIYGGLSEEACMELASYNWGGRKNDSLLGMGVGGSSYSNTILENIYQGCTGVSNSNYAAACYNGSTVAIPMSVGVAVNACNCNGSNCVLALKYF
jgi:hypothetical protein